MGRYARAAVAADTVDAVLLDADTVPDVLTFLGTREHAWDPASGVLSVQTRQGAVLNIRLGSYVVRDGAGHVSHMPADAFAATFAPLDVAPAQPEPASPSAGEVSPGIDDEGGEAM